MKNLASREQTRNKLWISGLIALVLLSGCLSPHYPHAQQLLSDLQQRGVEFKVDSPAVAVVASPMFPPELYPLLLFIYVREPPGVSGPPDHLFIYIAHDRDRADYAQSRIEDFAQAYYGLQGVDAPPGEVLHYYRCDETIAVYFVWGKHVVEPAVDKALTDLCGPAFVRYPPEK